MHNGDELYSELGLDITGDMLDSGGDGITSGEWGVHDYTKTFDLEVCFVQGLEGASIIEVMIKGYGKVWISDSSDKYGVFDGRREQVESVIVDGDFNGQDWGDFYSRQRQSTSYRQRDEQRGWRWKIRSIGGWGGIGEPKGCMFGSEEARGPSGGDNVREKGSGQ